MCVWGGGIKVSHMTYEQDDVNEPELLPAAIPMSPISPADRAPAEPLSEPVRSRSQIS